MDSALALQDEQDSPALVDAFRDPSLLGFPPMLPIELALRIDTTPKICAIYGISRDDFAQIIRHPVFVKAYQEAVESLKVDGMSFKLKAKMQAHEDARKAAAQTCAQPTRWRKTEIRATQCAPIS